MKSVKINEGKLIKETKRNASGDEYSIIRFEPLSGSPAGSFPLWIAPGKNVDEYIGWVGELVFSPDHKPDEEREEGDGNE